jgi:hypothetical protein
MVWPFVAGFCGSFLVWWLINIQLRCPSCRQRLTSRWELDVHDVDHLFYDCDECQITYDPKYAEGGSDHGIDASEN